MLAGLLVAAFAGALNFIGLKNGEISAVLRNDAHYPTVVLALIVTGILTAVASIFARPAWRVARWAWKATAAALVVPVALTVALIPIPGSTTRAESWMAIAVAVLGATVAVIVGALGVAGRWQTERSSVLAQGLLVFTAIALTATATYAGLRLETRSQLASTAAQLTATISEKAPTASLRLLIDASKMANVDRVYVSVTGLRSNETVDQFCQDVPAQGTLTCAQAPCFVKHYEKPGLTECVSLSSGIYQPNADGSVRQVVTIPFSDIQYQRLELLSEVCLAGTTGRPCIYRKSGLTRVDIQVPSYAP